MDGKPVQIIAIEKKDGTQNSQYKFQLESLFEILSSINDKEVAVISIAGQSRKGKSFLLSYLLRYLSDYTNVNWIGDENEPLKGFEWNHGTEPETQGIWIWSKPIIITQSIGKQIAIILMDTQGVYDEYTDLRDWSTIVGITLLTSSCFIFNVFTDIQEDVLQELEIFLNYGRLAVQKSDSNEPVFQKLQFLVRDWNHPMKYKYGITGGKNYLEHKLSIKDKQTESSQRTRALIRECFQEVTCYLMPDPGADKEDDKFNGSVSKMSKKFVDKMKEFFSHALNPEELKTKIVNGRPIRGRDLLKYFEEYVERFNSDELPKPIDLVQATAKATDSNLVHHLKEFYANEMHKQLEAKEFVTRNELEVINNNLEKEIKESFKEQKMTRNSELEKEILQMLNTELRNAYKKIYSENEEKRLIAANKTVEKCIEFYYKSVTEFLNSNYVKPNIFDEFLTQTKKSVKDEFNKKFCNEEKDFLEHHLLRIYESLEEAENSFKSYNYNRKSELKKINSEAVIESLTYYCEKIKSKLDENTFLTPDQLKQFEIDTKIKALKIFAKKCKGIDQSVKKFEQEIKSKLNEKKNEFEVHYSNKIKAIIQCTELEVNKAIKFYKEKMNEIVESLCGRDDLNRNHNDLKEKTIGFFEQKCIVKDFNFLSPYTRKLEYEIDKSFVEISQNYEKKIEDLNIFYDNTIDESTNKCFVEIKTLFDGKGLLSNEELLTFKDKLKDEVVRNYENIAKQGIFNDIEDFVNEKVSNAFDLLLVNRLNNYYVENLTEVLNTKPYFSRQELTAVHNRNKNNALDIFRANKKTAKNEVFNEYLAKLTNSLETIFKQFYIENEQKRESTVSEAIEKSSSFYVENMSEELNHGCVESIKFDEISTEVKENALKEFKDVCYEERELFNTYYSKISEMIENSENGFRNDNNSKLSEAKKRNSEAVKDSFNFYNREMDALLERITFVSMDTFKQFENEIRVEAINLFKNERKFGEIEFVNKFELELRQKIKDLKIEYKNKFQKKIQELESETQRQLNNALTYYNDVMYVLLDSVNSESKFRESHEVIKGKSFNLFKQSCKVEDNQFINEQISKLEREINEGFNGLQERLSSRIRKSEDYYKRNISQLFSSYVKLMDEIFRDKSFIPDKELEVLHQTIRNDVMNDFEVKFEEESDVKTVSEYKNSLEVQIMNKFQKIKNENKSKYEAYETLKLKVELEIKDFVRDYEERMDKMLEFCGNETELMNQHSIIGNDIKEEMLKYNPFDGFALFEPYLIKLDVELNKTLSDFSAILKVKLDKQTLELQNVVRDARKFYREEMNKYYQKTNFLKAENLYQCNRSVVERTIAKYESHKKNMSIENFKELIKDSLKDIYQEIIEQNDMNTPTLAAIGIDLGTTNSCVAYFQPSRPKGNVIIIPNDVGNKTTPSVVAFNENNEEVIIGESAKEHAYSKPRNTIFSAKRLIGRKFSDETVQNDMSLWPFKVVDDGNDIAKIQVKTNGSDKTFFPEEVSAKILKKLKQTAEKHLGCEVKNAVITVPAYFNDSQKEATKDAGAIAGLNVLKIINEPTAAAIAFQLNRSDEKESKNVLIYDFGGGTLDVVVLAIEVGNIFIKAVGGDNHLGGDDIDANLVKYCIQEFSATEGIEFDKNTEEGEKALRRLTTNCEKHKWELCATNSVTISVDNFYNGTDLRVELTREMFEELNDDIFVKSMDLVEQVLVDAKLDHSNIDDVVLVGGTTRIPKLQEMLSDLFYGKALNHSVNPDEAVAVGAAIQAAILNGALAQGWGHLKLSDVAPMSLGVKVKDGFMSIIVHRNSKVPHKYTKQYETIKDNQKEVDIEIYEGEETMAVDNRKLGTFSLTNIPPGSAGEQQIEVTFDINDEGILHVSAKIMSSGEEESIQITEHKGRLSDSQLQQLIEQETQ